MSGSRSLPCPDPERSKRQMAVLPSEFTDMRGRCSAFLFSPTDTEEDVNSPTELTPQLPPG
jgi:hypothetical protein